MKKTWVGLTIALLCANAAWADVALTDKAAAERTVARNLGKKAVNISPAEKAAIRAANQAKRDAKRAKQHGHSSHLANQSFTVTPNATGSVALIDAAGLKYFINTNITFSTSSSASAGMSEASYTHAVNATTALGGTSSTTLNDAYDGYQSICVSLTGATGPCATGNPSYVIYNKNGAATVDAGVPAGPNCTGRQYVFGTQNISGLSVQRKVYVPPNDQYARWMNIFTNTTGAPITFNMITSNNLGSDSNTTIVTSSSGDANVTPADTWATTFQNYSGNSSSDPRLGHVFWGTGAATPVTATNFANGDDNPYWSYNITLNPGQTKIIVNYATGQPSKAAAATKAANLAAFGANAQQCMTATELARVVNFAAAADLSIVKTANSATAFGGLPFSYTINVSNAGPATAASVSVTDVLPAGSGFVSATGTGWTCNNVAGTVTCTMPSLAVGAAAPITLTITAPTTPGTLTNTATVSSTSSDPNPANNSSTTSAAPLLPGSAAPTMSQWALILLAATLSLIAITRRT